jgi:hypothetical protein
MTMAITDDENYPLSLATLPNSTMPQLPPGRPAYLTGEVLNLFRDRTPLMRSNGDSIWPLDPGSAERQAREMEDIVRQFRGPPVRGSLRKVDRSGETASRPSQAYIADEISRQFRGGAPYVKGNGDPVLNAFDQFSAERQRREMEEIVRQFRGPEPPRKSVTDYLQVAITDIPDEVRRVQEENLDVIRKAFLPGHRDADQFERFLNTGRGLAALYGLAMAPVTGTARSLLGHPLADLTQFIGGNFTPEGYPRPTNEQLYEDWKRGVDLAFKARRPSGAPKIAPR